MKKYTIDLGSDYRNRKKKPENHPDSSPRKTEDREKKVKKIVADLYRINRSVADIHKKHKTNHG